MTEGLEIREPEQLDFEKIENEMIAESEAEEIAVQINAIKRQTAANVLMNAVEIGRLLVEAKNRVGHGNWGAWLRDNVAYSISTAENMMRLYREWRGGEQIDMFGGNDFGIFEGLEPQKVLALLAVPKPERKEFIEENNVAEMSVRELREAIKAREEAEKRASEAEEELAIVRDEKAALDACIDDVRENMRSAFEAEKKSAVDKAIKNAEDKAKKTAKEAAAEAAKKERALLTEKRDLTEKLKAAELAANEAAKEADEKAKKAAEDARREAEGRIAELEQKIAETEVAQSPHLVRFQMHMEAFQREYAAMTEVVQEAIAEDADIGEKLQAAMRQIKAALAEG